LGSGKAAQTEKPGSLSDFHLSEYGLDDGLGPRLQQHPIR